MQILIATQGVTPNSVEINTNCVLPATAQTFLPSPDILYLGCSLAPRGTFMQRLFLSLSLSLSLLTLAQRPSLSLASQKKRNRPFLLRLFRLIAQLLGKPLGKLKLDSAKSTTNVAPGWPRVYRQSAS